MRGHRSELLEAEACDTTTDGREIAGDWAFRWHNYARFELSQLGWVYMLFSTWSTNDNTSWCETELKMHWHDSHGHEHLCLRQVDKGVDR